MRDWLTIEEAAVQRAVPSSALPTRKLVSGDLIEREQRDIVAAIKDSFWPTELCCRRHRRFMISFEQGRRMTCNWR
ncbi:MAG: hypothetical protein IPF57_01670 [Gammaproteobacteria bacterium]|jgi:hypothetical protein|nr:hypothetical protein [Gammaproteobacteria bacterium]MBK8990550.1 hypothetical protein [Gammaproteobacteria bacterium]MBK9466403.1 hypothetical protein [Gammaproteobacteria bacterium]MBP7909028.1 hypothetical protein [Pseudomonadales bacterium]